MTKIQAEEIIVSHPGADFDSLASMVAASKLYPKAKMVLLAGMDIGVREFYALYRDHFPVVLLRQIDMTSVKRVIITDTSKPSRLRAISELLESVHVEVHLYDHHLDEEGELKVDFSNCQRYGATTTILVAEIARKGIDLTPEEATLFCLGIYEDTGNLTFASTTPQDLDAVRYLLERGANLSLVRRYISHELSNEQKVLLQKLTLNTRDMVINGIRIHFATARIPAYVDEIAFIANKIQDLENADCIFTLVGVGERVYVIGRSRIAPVNVAHILSYFGGGGHPSAGSAMLTGVDHHKALQELIEILRKELRPYVIARDIMSSPVRTVPPDTSLAECRQMMITLGHSGFVVTGEDGALAGVVTRRDVDKGILSGRGTDPVSGYMQRDVITATEETGLHQLENIIVRHNIGRIPIVFGGKISGIVTRSDIIRALHDVKPIGDEELEEIPFTDTLVQEDVFTGLPRLALNILILAGRVADRLKLSVYLVGGVVRDILLGRPSEDIDLVIEGDGIVFAEALGIALKMRVDVNPRFGTAKIHLHTGGTIDVAGTRKEHYPQPGALPVVEPGGIEDDLKRRDFTVNSIAIRINHAAFGKVLDPFEGRSDISNKIIRVIHKKSFEDDPTRIFRAARFAARFGFEIETNTLELIGYALEKRMLNEITKQRIREEIWIILNEKSPCKALRLLDDLKVLHAAHPLFKLPEIFLGDTDPVIPVLEEYETLDLPYAVRKYQVYLCLLFWDFTQDEIDNFCLDFQLAGVDENTIKDIPRFLKQMEEISYLEWLPKPSDIYERLHWVQVETFLAYLAIGQVKELKSLIRRFLSDIKPTKLQIDGQDLNKLGFPPSPAYKDAFRAVFKAKLDGKVRTREDELKLAEDILSESQGRPVC